MRKKVVTIGIRGKSIRPFLVLFLLVFSTLLQAQEKGETTDSLTQKPKHRVIWVADIESRKPLKNVTIQLDRRTEKVQTDLKSDRIYHIQMRSKTDENDQID